MFRWELALKALRARILILCLKEYKGMGHRAWRWWQELSAMVLVAVAVVGTW